MEGVGGVASAEPVAVVSVEVVGTGEVCLDPTEYPFRRDTSSSARNTMSSTL